MNDFPRADIYQVISSNLLHQVIKDGFKDHLVTWVGKYLRVTYPTARAEAILVDIDCWYVAFLSLRHLFIYVFRIAAVPHFPGLRRFKEGRNFKQWTGDDSKALMKVFIFSYLYSHAIILLDT
jgi:hypothetical protein